MATTRDDHRQKKVAVVGSGMAGLVTAYLLHHDKHQRFSVTIFEKGHDYSLDSASVSVQNDFYGDIDRIDVPMRAFADGYYRNLIRMYKYLGVQFQPQRFNYSFERKEPNVSAGRLGSRDCYFIHSSNHHRMPPSQPVGMGVLRWITEVIFVAFCYFWWSLCCFWLPPRTGTEAAMCESLAEYVERIMLPARFVNLYLLPLLSAVATCSHPAMLRFPATDVTEYKKLSASREHYTVDCLNDVQDTLANGLHSRFSVNVNTVRSASSGKLQVSLELADGSKEEELFDHVVLAVAPDVAGSIFQPAHQYTSQIPTTTVHSIVQGATLKQAASGISSPLLGSDTTRKPQAIHFRTSTGERETESIHIHPSGAVVRTVAGRDILESETALKSVRFSRVLRTTTSRQVVNDIFGETAIHRIPKDKHVVWRNGDEHVWLVGGWCWDGMVLLEGCVVSAMRVAVSLGVDIPWCSHKV